MNIKFTPKYLNGLLCGSVFAGASIVANKKQEEVKELTDIDFNLKLLESKLKNAKAAKNIYFADIMKSAKSKFDLDLNHLASCANYYSEPYHIVKSQNALFRFDIKTGEIIAVEKENQIYNLKDDFVTSLEPKLIKNDKEAFWYREKLLSADMKTTTLDGKPIMQYKFKPSKIEGEFEVAETDQCGKEYKIGLSEYDKKYNNYIEKHFTSPDGVVTDYVFSDDLIGNRYLYYKITDKDKNVLYKSEKKFKILSYNHFQSSTNGVVYDIVFENDRVIVEKLDGSGEKIEYKIKQYTFKEYEGLEDIIYKMIQNETLYNKLKNHEITLGELAFQKGVIEEFCVDKNLIGILKTLSGEEWFALKKSNVHTVNMSLDRDVAHSIGNGIELGEYNCYLSILEHEIGHEKSHALNLEKDEELKQIYEQEKNAFTTHFPNIAVKQAEYFIKNAMKIGLGETTAEANLIINCPQNWQGAGSRTLFLQQNFPRTIAYVAKRYEELY